MGRLIKLCTTIIITFSIFMPHLLDAQVPEKISYQAVIRDAGSNLIKNQSIGMRISILQNSASGTTVYMETHTPTTNANGLVSIEIGGGLVVSGTFSSIDWPNGSYFVKVETDPSGGLNYSIIGTSQLLSVPYALHAQSAVTLTGSINETDPVFGASIASGITGTDTAYWSNKLDSFTETDPVFDASVAGGITGSDTAKWNTKLDSYIESDPIFGASVASGITSSDTANWNTKLDSYIESDPVFGASVAGGITSSDTANWNTKLDSYIETDPFFGASVAGGITSSDTANWNTKLDSYVETDPVFGASVAKSIEAADTSYWNNKQTQLTAGPGISIVGNTIKATGSVSNDYYLGQDTLDGIVFYIYLDQNGNQHGLIVSKADTTAKWQNTATTTNATRSWDGVYNMVLMTNSPAKAWVTSLGPGWYLPSVDELSLLWHNRFHVNKELNIAGETLLSSENYYWSSTEYNISIAFNFGFSNGALHYANKLNIYSIRAIRAF